MIGVLEIDCACPRPDWPFLPVVAVAGSARTIGVTGLSSAFGVSVTGCRVDVTNADGETLSETCRRVSGGWAATFPSTHFASTGLVKGGVAVVALGSDEAGESRAWTVRTGDLKVVSPDASATPGGGGASTATETYVKSEVVDGVQHYKKLVLVYSERQKAWGADFVGDYVLSGGKFAEVKGEGEE